MAEAGYLVGLTVAPIMPLGDWRGEYGRLLDDVAEAVDGVPDVDLTVEAITHRFTDSSKAVLEDWYPRTRLEMDETLRSQKRTKFGGTKHVYPREVMGELRGWFTEAVADRLPQAPLLYWT
jgi:spore photoproduct lyase